MAPRLDGLRVASSPMTDRRRFLAWVFGLAGTFLAIVGLGRISTSSLALFGGTGEPNTARVVFGESRPIRSDEWLRTTPDVMGRLSDGWTPDFRPIFEARSSWPQPIVFVADLLQFPEREIAARVLGLRGFFVLWWIPVVLAFTALTGLFLLWGMGKVASILASVVVVAIPTNSWWSYHPLELIWPLSMAFVLLEVARRIPTTPDVVEVDSPTSTARTRVMEAAPWALSVLAGVLIGRLPFAYIPWAVPVFVVMAALVLDFVLWKRSNWRTAKLYLVCVAVFVVSSGVQLLVRWDLYRVLAQTVYPGGRRSTGGDLAAPVFSAAQSGFLQFYDGADLIGTNQSESAIGPIVLLVIALGFAGWACMRYGIRATVHQGVPLLSLALCGVLLLWSLFSWPSILLRFNPLVLLPGFRVVQILGVVSVVPSLLVLARLLPLLRKSNRVVLAGLVFVSVAGLSVAAGREFDDFLPSLSTVGIVASAVVFAVSIALSFLLFPRNYFLAPMAVFFILSSLWVNPVVIGLGDLRDSTVASELRASVDASLTSRVAADEFTLGALGVANGFPVASGQIAWGPDETSWSILDETGQYEDVWNRGSSSMWFSWQPGVAEPVLTTPSPDVIVVAIDPCSPLLREVAIGWILSTVPIAPECAEEVYAFEWMGSPRSLYRLR